VDKYSREGFASIIALSLSPYNISVFARSTLQQSTRYLYKGLCTNLN
jgi:hypothetical protein